MELNIVKTTRDGLDSGMRCVLALKNEPFFFILCRGVLYMNKGMKNTRKITEAVRTMWQYDLMENQEIMDEVDAAYGAVKQAAGEKAADQLWRAWSDAAKQSREDRAVKRARDFIDNTMARLSDQDWDEMADAGYDSTFVDTGLWRAYSDLNDENPDRLGYRNWSGNARTAAFVYGYIMGKAAAAKAEGGAKA